MRDADASARNGAIASTLRAAFFALCGLVGGTFLLLPAIYSKYALFGPLWFYGLIIVVLSIAGVLFDRRGAARLALALAYLLAFDLSMAVGTRIANRLQIADSFMPNSGPSVFVERGFRFHPLLQLALNPGYDNDGFVHTPQGTRAVEEPKVAPNAAPPVNVALVGGSSTYDIDLRQGQTWPDQLQRLLPSYRFWNFGVPSHTTVAHIINTAWYLPEVNARCAVYYFGWNDIRNNNLPALDPAYAEYHLLDLGAYGHTLSDRSVTATGRLVYKLAAMISVYPEAPAVYTTVTPKPGIDPALERFYRRNIETLIGINRARGVRTAFIGQLLNDPVLRSQPEGQRHFAAPGVQDRDIPELMDRFNAVLGEEAAKHGVPFLQPAQTWLAGADYTDFGHFTESGARKFSQQVAPFIDAACKAP